LLLAPYFPVLENYAYVVTVDGELERPAM